MTPIYMCKAKHWTQIYEFRKESFNDSDKVAEVDNFLSIQKALHALPFNTLQYI